MTIVGYADSLLSTVPLMSDAQNFIAGGALINAGTGSGTANAQTATSLSPVTAYYTGMQVLYFPSVSNSGACTFNLSSLGVKIIRKQIGDGTSYDLHTGDIGAYVPCLLVYDGTYFRLVNQAKTVSVWTPAYSSNFTSVTNTRMRFWVDGYYVNLDFACTGTYSGSGTITMTAPIAPAAGIYEIFTALRGATFDTGYLQFNGTPGALETRSGGNPASGSQTFEGQGRYPWV